MKNTGVSSKKQSKTLKRQNIKTQITNIKQNQMTEKSNSS